MGVLVFGRWQSKYHTAWFWQSLPRLEERNTPRLGLGLQSVEGAHRSYYDVVAVDVVALQAKAGVSGSSFTLTSMSNCWGPDAYITSCDIDCEIARPCRRTWRAPFSNMCRCGVF